MKFAIPTANDQLCLHFGHCESFCLIDVDTESKTIIKKEFLTPPEHQPGVIPAWLAEHKADIIIAGGMGVKAQAIFNHHNIKTVIGAEPDEPEKLVMKYLEGTLQTGLNTCDHSGCSH